MLKCVDKKTVAARQENNNSSFAASLLLIFFVLPVLDQSKNLYKVVVANEPVKYVGIRNE